MISGLVPSSCLLFLIAPETSDSPSGLEKTGTVFPVDPLSDSFLEILMEVSSSSPSGVSPSIAPTVTLVTSTVDFVVLYVQLFPSQVLPSGHVTHFPSAFRKPFLQTVVVLVLLEVLSVVGYTGAGATGVVVSFLVVVVVVV